MSRSATSRPKAKYSSIVPVPTVARVWPWRSPHQVFGSPGRRALTRFDSARCVAVCGDDARLAAGVGDAERAHRGDGELAAAKRDPGRKPGDPSAAHAERHVARESLARVTPEVFGLHQGLEGLAGVRGRRRDHDQPVEVAPDDVERGRPGERRIELGAEGIDQHPPLTATLAECLGARPGPSAAPIPEGDVHLVARIERSIADRDDQALEPGADVAARLPAQMRDGGRAAGLEPDRRVVGRRRVRELGRSPVRGEAARDLQPGELVVAVLAHFVGDRPAAGLAGDDRPGRRDPRAADISRLRVDRHQCPRSGEGWPG